MEISSEQQDVIDSIVGTIQDARTGNAKTILGPHISTIVALCDMLMNRNPVLRDFVRAVQSSVNAIAIQKSADEDAATWHRMANEINSLLGD